MFVGDVGERGKFFCSPVYGGAGERSETEGALSIGMNARASRLGRTLVTAMLHQSASKTDSCERHERAQLGLRGPSVQLTPAPTPNRSHKDWFYVPSRNCPSRRGPAQIEYHHQKAIACR
jgi:hypothetical protein